MNALLPRLNAAADRSTFKLVDAVDVDRVVAWSQEKWSAHNIPQCLYFFHDAWEPAVDKAVAAKRLTPCTPAIGGEMGMIGYWVPEKLAERLDHELYIHLRDHEHGGFRTADGWGRSLESAVECLCWLVDVAELYEA